MPEAPIVAAVEPVQVRTVLLTLDGGDEALRALPVAVRLAARMGARLSVLAVAEQDARLTALEQHVDRAAALAGGASCAVTSCSAVAPAILDAACRTPRTVLLCMASHGRGRAAGVVGSVTRDVAARATVPFVVVGPRVPEGHELSGRLAACVDGFALSESVLPVAAGWGAALRLPLSIVTVAEPIPEPVTVDAPYRRMHGPETDADAYIAALVERWSGHGIEVGGEAVYDPVSVVDGIVDDVARHATALLAAVTRARRGVARAVLGSVASGIIRRAPVPVLLVPPRAVPDTSPRAAR